MLHPSHPINSANVSAPRQSVVAHPNWLTNAKSQLDDFLVVKWRV